MLGPLLEVKNLSKTFRYRDGFFRRHQLEAVKPVSFTLQPARHSPLPAQTAPANPPSRGCYPG